MRSTSLALAAPVLAYFLSFACGGRTLAGSDGTNSGGGGGGSSTGGGGGAGGGTAVSPGEPGESCVNVDLSAYDTSCIQNTDCISVNVGQVCSGTCLCGGGGAISASAQPEYKAALSSIQTNDTCPCPPARPVACVAGQCTQQCNFNPNDPFDCPGGDSEGGLEAAVMVVSEGGGPEDSSVCVDVDISTYDTSCSQDSDCIGISGGEICPRSTCFCGGSAVNVLEQSRYQAAISSIVVADEQAPPFVCACPPVGIPVCAAGRCTLCTPDLADGGCVP
jgi:hypothetical protein